MQEVKQLLDESPASKACGCNHQQWEYHGVYLPNIIGKFTSQGATAKNNKYPSPVSAMGHSLVKSPAFRKLFL
jgi:hypothetical protein